MLLHKASLSHVSSQSNVTLSLISYANMIRTTMLSDSISVDPTEDEAHTCLSALFLTDPRDDRAKLITTKGPRVDRTCRWITSHALYDSWLRSNSQLLWLSGGPGKGKTMLSIFLAEELEQTARSWHNKPFLQYFCDNKDEKRNTAIAILRGLIYQLLQFRRELFDHILPIFRIQKESVFSFETLWRIFESMVCDPTLETSYCVLDGLDECEEASLEMLLGKLAALLSTKTKESSACHLNLLIVSRDLPDLIPELLASFPRISLESGADTEINKDIDVFIKAKVTELSTRKQYPEALRVHVVDVFRNRAQGTFLWIGIVAQALRKHKATEVEKALDLFPSGLDEVYVRILLQIDSGRREVAARILRWVVMAVRPLTLSELSIAIETTVEPSIVAFDHDERIRDQVSYCGSFLMIKEDEVGLVHQSAKEYLLRKTWDSNPDLEVFRVKEEVANLEIARRCLDYLHAGALGNGEPKLFRNIKHLRAFPFLSYAALHWHEHARSLARSEDIFDLSLPFYHEKSQIRMSWLKAYWALQGGEPPESFTLLHLASCFGILPLAENLILTKNWIEKMNDIDGQRLTALMWAASCGHEAIVWLLLENGANIEIKTRFRERALTIAAERGHKAVVRQLLEKGAGTAVKQSTALIMAAQFGHEAVVQLLLEKGADIEAKTEYQSTALITAAGFGREAIVRLLLEKGADIEAKNNDWSTALIMAALLGHEAAVRLLLEKGADIKAKDKYHSTVLIAACSFGHEAVVRLLLEKGADIEAKDNDQSTALTMAALLGYEAVVRLLLEKGADIEAKNNDWSTALILAAEIGHEAVVRLLLKKGADIEAKNNNQSTALILAAQVDCEAVVRLLLEKGADVEAKDKYQSTALVIAAEEGHEAVVRLLLEKGADINAKNKQGDTALKRAERHGHKAIIRLLTL